MRPGTIVVCLPHKPLNEYITWYPQLDKRTPYMIREFLGKDRIQGHQDEGVYFEEGVIGVYNGNEIAYPVRFLREILPPDDIPEEIKERVEEPMYA